MMRPHCDRCDVYIEEGFASWVEYPYADDKRIYHVQIHEGGDVRNLSEKMYCKHCAINILLELVNRLTTYPTTPPVSNAPSTEAAAATDDIPF